MDSVWVFVVFTVVAVLWCIAIVLDTNKEIKAWEETSKLLDEEFLKIVLQAKRERNAKVHK